MSDPSIQGVEEALRRLNATLETYKTRPASGNIGNATKGRSKKTAKKANNETFSTEIEHRRMFKARMELTSKEFYPNITNEKLRIALNRLHELRSWLVYWPYSIELYVEIARAYVELGYPDLAVGTTYKALLLIDAANDESDEYHADSIDTVKETICRQSVSLRISLVRDHPAIFARYNPDTLEVDEEGMRILRTPELDEVLVWVRAWYTPQVYVLLAQCLHVCGCERSAYKYCQLGLQHIPKDQDLLATRAVIMNAVEDHFVKTRGERKDGQNKIGPEDFPDEGMVRRELYPWNSIEPDRFSKESLDFLNDEMAEVAPKLEVRAVELPDLTSAGKKQSVKQLGVFAKEDIAPGEVVLEETSLLTANNRLQDALCDACSEDLPDLATISSGPGSTVVSCPECEAVFCSQRCYDLAQETYHPALCDQDVETLAKDVSPAQAANSLYTLLLLRALSMAETQQVHPLSLKEVQYIWGDYHTVSLNKHWMPHSRTRTTSPFPQTLPFSFNANVVLPFHMLTKMDVNIFENPYHYDTWVFNTLYAKFRGTASARLSGLGGRPIRGPEVSAVHPLWCLANHSCDPNVSWEWGGSIKFWAREERPEWKNGRDGELEVNKRTAPGLKKGEEVLNHYCDVELPVRKRREWAVGALGGECRCERCVWEAERDEGSASYKAK